MFVTLDSSPGACWRVSEDGAPADPLAPMTTTRAARDALTFAALFDRFIQNLRRYLGYDLQYFAAIEPQRRPAPHVHIAMRGTIARTEIRRILAATYYQVWWPDTTTSNTTATTCPCGMRAPRATSTRPPGEVLPSWDQALDELGD